MIVTERLVSREIKLQKNGAAQIYTDIFIETMEWETAIKRKKAEASSYEERFHYYVSTGVLDEHTSQFCSLRRIFNNIANTFDELTLAIKEYQKELMTILYQENKNPDKEELLQTHENLGKYSKNYALSVGQQLTEINEKLDKVCFGNYE